MRIIMLGAPGAGKGTQADKIAEKYNIPHISTGDIFRENMRNETELGLIVKEYLENGTLVPDELTIKLVMDRLKADDCKKGFILDGFPRTIPQAESLTNELASEKISIDYAIDVEVADEIIIKRISGRRSCPKCSSIYHIDYKKPKFEGKCDNDGAGLIQRKDDTPETVLKRLEVYHAQTKPLIDYYKKEGVLFEIDGTLSTNDVFESIVKVLGD